MARTKKMIDRSVTLTIDPSNPKTKRVLEEMGRSMEKWRKKHGARVIASTRAVAPQGTLVQGVMVWHC